MRYFKVKIGKSSDYIFTIIENDKLTTDEIKKLIRVDKVEEITQDEFLKHKRRNKIKL